MSGTAHRVVAITGASSGIGRATAGLFARQGWCIGLIARGEAGLEAVRKEVVTQGGTASVAPADVADAEALERAAQHIETELGPIDVWVNDAGVSFFAPFMEITEEEFRRVTDVTYLGQVHGTRVALRRMLPRDSGVIVNVCSVAGLRAFPMQSPYCAAKFAVRGFSEALRTELMHARSRVRLSLVHPPSVNTPFFSHAGARMEGVPRPPPPVFQPEVIADAILLAATTGRREIKVTSATTQLAWMATLAPGLTDRMTALLGPALQRTRNPKARALHHPTLFEPPSSPSPARGPWLALGHSAQLWAARHRRLTALLLLGGLAAGLSRRG